MGEHMRGPDNSIIRSRYKISEVIATFIPPGRSGGFGDTCVDRTRASLSYAVHLGRQSCMRRFLLDQHHSVAVQGFPVGDRHQLLLVFHKHALSLIPLVSVWRWWRDLVSVERRLRGGEDVFVCLSVSVGLEV